MRKPEASTPSLASGGESSSDCEDDQPDNIWDTAASMQCETCILNFSKYPCLPQASAQVLQADGGADGSEPEDDGGLALASTGSGFEAGAHVVRALEGNSIRLAATSGSRALRHD